jgi:chemotaxis protein methyltransferase CheR
VTLAAETLAGARALIADRFGLEFPPRRGADLERALQRAVPRSSQEGVPGLLQLLATAPDSSRELARLIDRLTIGETHFFRDRACFDALQHEVLPSLIARRRADGTHCLRIWSAGCATGEEPFSLAMLLDQLLPDRPSWDVDIWATDVSLRALDRARAGRYRSWSFRDTPDGTVERYFEAEEAGGWRVIAPLRQMVRFAQLNLAAERLPDYPADLLLCRNVLMYFTPAARRRAAAQLGRSLAPDGFLVTSPAEAAAIPFEPLASVPIRGACFFQPVGQASAPPPSPRAAVLPLAALLDPEAWFPTHRVAIASTPDSTIPAAALQDLAQSPSLAASQIGAAVVPAPDDPTDVPAAADDAAQALQLARSLADAGRLDESRELCAAAIERDVLSVDAQFLMAMICHEQGDAPTAIRALRAVLYLSPESPEAQFLLGRLQVQRHV